MAYGLWAMVRLQRQRYAISYEAAEPLRCVITHNP